MVLVWENLQEVFVMLVVVGVVAGFYLTGGFSFHCFSTSPLTFPLVITRFLHPFYTFSPVHRRVIRDTFILTFPGFSFFTASVLSVFYPLCFLPHTPSFVTQMRAGTPHPGSSSVPALTELSLPADAWT